MANRTGKRNFLFDLIASQPNESGTFHGGGKYAKKVFLEFVKTYDRENWKVFALFDSTIPLDEQLRNVATEADIPLVDVRTGTLAQIISERSIARFYSALPLGTTKFGFNDVLGSECEIFGTIHGLRTLEMGIPTDAMWYETTLKGKGGILARSFFRKRLYNRDWRRYNSLLKSTRILAVSEHTKYSILAHFPEARQEIQVFYSPDVTEFENKSADPSATDFSMTGYYLMISGNRWLKNNLRSAIALDQLFSERPQMTHNVIITGVNDPQVFLKRIRNKSRFVFYKYVSESLLETLYKNAYAFLYMTLNEGFGYPPLDAMKQGVPVVTTPFTSIVEVCGDAVLYSNPYSIQEIKNRILQLGDSSIYNRLAEDGKDRYMQVRSRQDLDLKKMIQYLSNS